MTTSALSKLAVMILLGVLDFSLALSPPPRAWTTNPYVIVDSVKENPYVITDKGEQHLSTWTSLTKNIPWIEQLS